MATVHNLERTLEDALDFGFVYDLVMSGPDGKEVAHRLVTTEMSVATDVRGEKISEHITAGCLWQGTKGKERELAVAERFIQFKNARGASLLAPPCEPEDPAWDACVCDENSPEPLRIQVVVSETNFDAQKALRSNGRIERSYGSHYVREMLSAAISKKSQKYDASTRSKTILLLDGWPSVRRDDIETFRISSAEWLSNTGFKEIWFVGPNGGPVEQLL